MAQTLEQGRSKAKTSIHGRRLGIDDTEHLTGVKGIRNVVTNHTSNSTGTNIPNHGVAVIESSGTDSFTLDDPIEGCVIHIAQSSTAGTNTIVPANASFQTSASSTGKALVMSGLAGVTLVGASTSLWLASGRSGTTVAVHFTT